MEPQKEGGLIGKSLCRYCKIARLIAIIVATTLVNQMAVAGWIDTGLSTALLRLLS